MRTLTMLSLSLSALALAACVPPRSPGAPSSGIQVASVDTTGSADIDTAGESAPDTLKLVAEAQGILRGDYGVPNDARAAALLTEAADHYSTSALIPLGDLYRTGRGVPVDATKARELYERAIIAGQFKNGHYALGRLYLAGALRDPAAAMRHFEQAVSTGSAPALIAMGDMYRTADGVPMDLERARRLYLQAIAAGSAPNGAFSLGVLYRDAQPPDAERAIAYFEQSAKAGRGAALTAIGDMYRDGKGVPKDPSLARQYYERAIAAGETGPASYAVAGLYRDPAAGNPAAAIPYLEQSAAGGRAASYSALAEMYRRGEGVPADVAMARHYYEEALAAGDVKGGAYGLGVLARDAPAADLFSARRHFEQAAAAGSGPAHVALAEMARQVPGDAAQRAAMIAHYKAAAGLTRVESVARSVLRGRGAVLTGTIEGLLQAAGYGSGDLGTFCAARAVAGCSVTQPSEPFVVALLQAPNV